jgi:hypothetical protein
MSAATLLTSFAALAALALCMGAHRRAVLAATRAESVPSWIFAGVGWSLLIFALRGAAARQGWLFGAVCWLAATAVAGFIVTMVLAFRPRLLPGVASAALFIAVAVTLVL